jgi:hypothetical protein
VPASNPVYIRVRDRYWQSSNSVDVMIDFDFFGLNRYRIGIGCLGFPDGFTHAPVSVSVAPAAVTTRGSMSKDAALSFSVTQLQGINFELSPDLSPVVFVEDRWTSDGKIDIGLQLGFFGLFVASVRMGCLTMGTSWTATSTFTFSGRCDNAWKVSFDTPGYSSCSKWLDARISAGSAAGVVVPPTPAPLPVVAAPATVAQGGQAERKVIGGKTHMMHTYTLDSENEFAVTSEMEGVPIEYLIVAGGGSGASNKTGDKVGVGGGGAEGVLANLGGSGGGGGFRSGRDLPGAGTAGQGNGGGGGGGNNRSLVGGFGGSGIVNIRYLVSG